MSAFENAKLFFTACETAQGWAGCKAHVENGAAFAAQSEPIADIDTVEGYCEWMAAISTVTAPGATYDLHTSSYDQKNNKATFFATYHATHTGDGGPVPPTGKQTNSHYVYVLSMNTDNKVESMIKIWNAPWAMKELGWA